MSAFTMRKALLALVAAPLLGKAVADLDPNCAPGGNFDLSPWNLALPTGPVNNPDTKSSSDLYGTNGCDGFQDFDYFFTESGDGAMVMKVPDNSTGCTKYAESEHCRTEFGENNDWDSNGSQNRMMVDLAGQGGSDVCVGQVFQSGDNPLKPLLELYYYSNSSLFAGVAYASEGGGGQNLTEVGQIPLQERFTYELRFENGGDLGIIVNGGDYVPLQTYFDTQRAFFKMGNYDQGTDASDIHVFGLSVHHED